MTTIDITIEPKAHVLSTGPVITLHNGDGQSIEATLAHCQTCGGTTTHHIVNGVDAQGRPWQSLTCVPCLLRLYEQDLQAAG